jgi:hypothetical protein
MTTDVLNGGTMVAGAVIALFFFRYWSVTRDRLYAMFAAAFLTFAVSRGILSLLDEAAEGRVFIFTLRLLAFALILAAIIDKNRSRPKRPPAHSHNGSGPPREARRASSATHEM